MIVQAGVTRYYPDFRNREYTCYTYATSPALVAQIASRLELDDMPFGIMLKSSTDPDYLYVAELEIWYTFDEPYERRALYYQATIISYMH
jgi:hypothetical protein